MGKGRSFPCASTLIGRPAMDETSRVEVTGNLPCCPRMLARKMNNGIEVGKDQDLILINTRFESLRIRGQADDETPLSSAHLNRNVASVRVSHPLPQVNPFVVESYHSSSHGKGTTAEPESMYPEGKAAEWLLPSRRSHLQDFQERYGDSGSALALQSFQSCTAYKLEAPPSDGASSPVELPALTFAGRTSSRSRRCRPCRCPCSQRSPYRSPRPTVRFL